MYQVSWLRIALYHFVPKSKLKQLRSHVLHPVGKCSPCVPGITSWIDVSHTNGLMMGSCMQWHLRQAWQPFSFGENLCQTHHTFAPRGLHTLSMDFRFMYVHFRDKEIGPLSVDCILYYWHVYVQSGAGWASSVPDQTYMWITQKVFGLITSWVPSYFSGSSLLSPSYYPFVLMLQAQFHNHYSVPYWDLPAHPIVPIYNMHP